MGSRQRSRSTEKRSSLLLFVALVSLALLSLLGLEYINRKNVRTSHLSFGPAAEEAEKTSVLGDLVKKRLAEISIPAQDQSQFWDRDNVFHLKTDLLLADYALLQAGLEQDFAAAGATIVRRDEHQDSEKNYFLWLVEGRDRQKLSVLFSCLKTNPEAAPTQPENSPRNKVAVIVDDMGYSLKAINDVCRMKKALTVSILPYTPNARETAELANSNGLDVLLHLPLESMNGETENAMDGIVLTSMSRIQIMRTVEANLSQVPFIKGVNNHMGSKFTGDREAMKAVLDVLKKKRLFFVDSLTTGESLAYEEARSMGIPAAERSVFLDVELDEKAIGDRLEELFRTAARRGSAVGICHPSDVTLRVLRDKLSRLDSYGLELVPVSDLVR